jgi:hypothetical protein
MPINSSHDDSGRYAIININCKTSRAYKAATKVCGSSVWCCKFCTNSYLKPNSAYTRYARLHTAYPRITCDACLSAALYRRPGGQINAPSHRCDRTMIPSNSRPLDLRQQTGESRSLALKKPPETYSLQFESISIRIRRSLTKVICTGRNIFRQ